MILKNKNGVEMERLWQTKNGNVIPIKNMATEHIKNAINYIKKNPITEITEIALLWLNEELNKREKTDKHNEHIRNNVKQKCKINDPKFFTERDVDKMLSHNNDYDLDNALDKLDKILRVSSDDEFDEEF